MATPTLVPNKLPVTVVNRPPAVPPPQFRAPSEMTTPQWLKGSVVLAWALTIGFVLMSISAVREHRDAIKDIADNSAKSVIAAQRIASALSDMDANAANGLLVVQQKDEASKAYQKARAQLAAALVDASHNITYAGEEKLLRELTEQSSEYDARIAAANTLQSAGAGNPVSQYNRAALILDTRLLTSARDLDKLNHDALLRSFGDIQSVQSKYKGLVWLSGLALLALLIRVQYFLSERTRRTLNPLLMLATLVTGFMLIYTAHAMSVARSETIKLKQESFDSVHALWQAKAVAYQANAEESRYLLDTANAQKHTASFQSLSAQLTTDPQQLAKNLAFPEDHPQISKSATGFLVDEARNLTYPGEKDAVAETAKWWSIYQDIDGRIRSLENQGRHKDAIALCIGNNPNESNFAFDKFDERLTEALDINQREFDKSRGRGLEVLNNFEWASSILGLIAALCALAGVWPRVREYTA